MQMVHFFGVLAYLQREQKTKLTLFTETSLAVIVAFFLILTIGTTMDLDSKHAVDIRVFPENNAKRKHVAELLSERYFVCGSALAFRLGVQKIVLGLVSTHAH
jgi:hypothetical protein